MSFDFDIDLRRALHEALKRGDDEEAVRIQEQINELAREELEQQK